MAFPCSRHASSSALRHFARSTSIRTISNTPPRHEEYYNPWSSKTHLKPPPSIPSPLPAIYPQKIVLSDGSTFTSYTTAPTPSTIRLTRDVTNNPLWKPGADRRGLGEDGGGGGGKFRRRFEGVHLGGISSAQESEVPEEADGVRVGEREISFGEVDLEWMGEGAREEKAPKVRERTGAAKGGKKK